MHHLFASAHTRISVICATPRDCSSPHFTASSQFRAPRREWPTVPSVPVRNKG